MRIFSIFKSLNGEVNASGPLSMTVFIRFAGCSASCAFCDTLYAKDFNAGEDRTVSDILKEVSAFDCNNVTITGGEPMEQRNGLAELLKALVDNQYKVSVETNGFHNFNKLHAPWCHVNWVVDIKPGTPCDLISIGEMYLQKTDYIKMVVGSKTQMVEAVARKTILQRNNCRATFAFSPEYKVVSPNQLMEWMKEFGQNDAVMNIQLHKVLDLIEEN